MVTVLTRDDTADAALVHGLLVGDEYGLTALGGRTINGVGLDIGAHIGTISLALLADHPGLSMVAVEPLAENCDLIRRAGASWLAQGRLIVEEAAAGAPDDPIMLDVSWGYTHHDGTERSYVDQNRYVGGMWKDGWEGQTVTVPRVTLAALALEHAPQGFILTKTDAEGAEYAFLSDPKANRLAGLIIGEWHDGGPERITALLEPTHTVTIREDHGGTGIFWAVPR